MTKYEDAINFDCPKCGAPMGKHCYFGADRKPHAHRERHELIERDEETEVVDIDSLYQRIERLEQVLQDVVEVLGEQADEIRALKRRKNLTIVRRESA